MGPSPRAKNEIGANGLSNEKCWLKSFNFSGLGQVGRPPSWQEAEKLDAFAHDRTVQLRAPAGQSYFITISGEALQIGSEITIWLTEADAQGARMAGFVQISA